MKREIGEIYVKEERVTDILDRFPFAVERVVTIYVQLLESLDNVVCVKELGDIKWIEQLEFEKKYRPLKSKLTPKSK